MTRIENSLACHFQLIPVPMSQTCDTLGQGIQSILLGVNKCFEVRCNVYTFNAISSSQDKVPRFRHLKNVICFTEDSFLGPILSYENGYLTFSSMFLRVGEKTEPGEVLWYRKWCLLITLFVVLEVVPSYNV